MVINSDLFEIKFRPASTGRNQDRFANKILREALYLGRKLWTLA